MPKSSRIQFPPFTLDLELQSLTRGTERITLRPKTWAVLCELASVPGRLLTKDDLLNAVWPNTSVSEWTLNKSIRELRVALGDDRAAPRFIETVHGRGFRFVGVAAEPAVFPWFVGRAAELDELRQQRRAAGDGGQRIVVVSGEAGIGKSTLVECFLAELRAEPHALWARGQCVQQRGESEPYLPFLEILGRLTGMAEAAPTIEALRQCAPTWLMQMPWLHRDSDLAVLRRRLAGATPQRMWRELAAFLDKLCGNAVTPPVLVIEDLQWSDPSSLALLRFLAQRPDASPCVWLLTARDTQETEGQTTRDLLGEWQIRGLAHTVRLGRLAEPAVLELIERRFPPRQLPPALGRALHQRSGGNPLLLTALADSLVQQLDATAGTPGAVDLEAVAHNVPDSVREWANLQLTALPEATREVVQAAALCGDEFTTQAVAAALAAAPPQIEQCCGDLGRDGLFIEGGTEICWPDGSKGLGFHFRHALYRDVVAAGIGPTRRSEWHGRIAERLEQGCGDNRDWALRIAQHAEAAGDAARAALWLDRAAANASQRFAYDSARTLLQDSLRLLATCPEGIDRDVREIMSRGALATAVIAIEGLSSAKMESNARRALELAERLGSGPAKLAAMSGLFMHAYASGDLPRCRVLAEMSRPVAEELGTVAALAGVDLALGQTALGEGDLLGARAHLEKVLEMAQREPFDYLGVDAQLAALAGLALVVTELGYVRDGIGLSDRMLERADQVGTPGAIAMATGLAAQFHAPLRHDQRCLELAERNLVLAAEYGFQTTVPLVSGWAKLRRGDDSGRAEIDAAMAAYFERPQRLGRWFFYALLIEALNTRGDVAEARAALGAMVENIGSELRAEVHYLLLEGETTRQESNGGAAAIDAFERARAVAQRRSSRLWELRAAMSLGAIHIQHGRPEEARAVLEPICVWFADEPGFPDLDDARRLLAQLPVALGNG